jgi:hypothetical protein
VRRNRTAADLGQAYIAAIPTDARRAQHLGGGLEHHVQVRGGQPGIVKNRHWHAGNGSGGFIRAVCWHSGWRPEPENEELTDACKHPHGDTVCRAAGCLNDQLVTQRSAKHHRLSY